MKLEERLYELSKCNVKCTEIYNIWQFIKKDISSQLDNVSVYFPHFSLHDSSHSETIISQVERILGVERINLLSFSDLFSLLLVAYSHDLGMVLKYNEVEEYFSSEKYLNDLEEISKKENSPLYNTAKRLTGVDILNKRTKLDYTSSLKIYEDVLMLVEFHFRNNHANRSSDMLLEYLCGKLQINRIIGVRIIRLLARICKLHQMDFNHILELQHMTNGIADDYCHPRFIALMLCLGDLLDLDTDRFNEYYLEVTTPLPIDSEMHKSKHESILHYLVDTRGIEVIAECETKEVYRILQGWIEWIDELLKFSALNWSSITQNGFGNSPSLLKREISFKNNRSWLQYNNLKFTISKDRAVELLQGANIYRSKFVFLREIIQNAVDASLIQLWKKLSLEGELKILENNILESIINDYDISLKIVDIDGRVQIELRDKGTGISVEDILSISKVGNKSKKHEVLNKIPEWLKPAGAFGLGLQSIFMVANEFEIITKTEDEKAKRIRFESTTNAKGYIDIEDYDKRFERGSLIIVKIDNSKIKYEDLYCSRFNYETETKSKLIQQHLYNIYNNKTEGQPIGFTRTMKFREYVNVNWKILLNNGETVIDKKFYTTIFDDEFHEVLTGKLTDNEKSLDYKYFDRDTLSICSLNFIDFYDEDSVIKFNGYNRNFNASLFFKHEFVKDEVIKERSALSHSSHYKNFDFSINLLSGNAERILKIDRRGIKEESEQLVIDIVEKSIKNTCLMLIDHLLINDVSLGSMVFKIFEEAIFYEYKVDEFYKKFCNTMAKYSFGNYITISANENSKEYNTTIDFYDLYNSEIIFVGKEITTKAENPTIEIVDLSSTEKVFWLTHNSIQNPNYATQKICASHEIMSVFLASINEKVYYCIKVKPFRVGKIRNKFDKDDYLIMYDFIFALINDYRAMLGNSEYSKIGVSTENRFNKNESLLLELILPTTQRVILKEYLLGKRDAIDEDKIVNEIVISEEYEKTIKYISQMNELTVEDVEVTYKKFIIKLLGLLKNKEKMSPYIDEFLKEINSNPRAWYPSSSKLEDILYSNDYII